MPARTKIGLSLVCVAYSGLLLAHRPPTAPAICTTAEAFAQAYTPADVGVTARLTGVVTVRGSGPPTELPHGCGLYAGTERRVYCLYRTDFDPRDEPTSGIPATVTGTVAGMRGDTIYLNNCSVE